ncbi:HAD family phosphatase OS=Streptomyces rimosus subsp. rimosus (strain ATCC / DSM 40260 / JCM 4667 / NRRL 2234) OX=1265868 GN=SRIM_031750 PE=4 SV=1 [Streptomyces rimosus subsp. rimosus]
MTGATRTVRNIRRKVADALGTPFDEERIAELIAADVASWSGGSTKGIVEYVGRLADRGTTIGLLSNIPAELAARLLAHEEWLKRFSVLAFSCRIGHAKPESGAYTWCSTAFGLPPERILVLFDDRDANVRAAEALGMRGHVFTSLRELRPVLE